jgi:hypothetical protein
MYDTMMRLLDAGFGHPHGLLGRIGDVRPRQRNEPKVELLAIRP